MKAKEARKARSYKVTDKHYFKALKRAEKEKGHLANILENVVMAYSEGLVIKAVKKQEKGAIALDVFTSNFSIELDSIRR